MDLVLVTLKKITREWWILNAERHTLIAVGWPIGCNIKETKLIRIWDNEIFQQVIYKVRV